MTMRPATCLLICAVAGTGCIHSQTDARQYYRATGFGPAQGGAERTLLLLVTDGTQKGFPRSFETLYGTEVAFTEHLGDQLSQQLHDRWDVYDVRVSEEPALRSIVEHGFALSVVRAQLLEAGPVLERLASDASADQILLIRRWRIAYHVTHEVWASSGPVWIPGDGGWTMGPSFGGGTAEIEHCLVELEGGVFDSQGELLVWGSAAAQSSVELFSYETTLRHAVAEAVERFAELLIAGL